MFSWSMVVEILKQIQSAWKDMVKPVPLPKPVDTKPAKDLLDRKDK